MTVGLQTKPQRQQSKTSFDDAVIGGMGCGCASIMFLLGLGVCALLFAGAFRLLFH